jgi:chromosome segregation ATPase
MITKQLQEQSALAVAGAASTHSLTEQNKTLQLQITSLKLEQQQLKTALADSTETCSSRGESLSKVQADVASLQSELALTQKLRSEAAAAAESEQCRLQKRTEELKSDYASRMADVIGQVSVTRRCPRR